MEVVLREAHLDRIARVLCDEDRYHEIFIEHGPGDVGEDRIETATTAIDLDLALERTSRGTYADQVLEDNAGLGNVGFQFGIGDAVALGAHVVGRFETVDCASIFDCGLGHFRSSDFAIDLTTRPLIATILPPLPSFS